MLVELLVKNLALIDSLAINFTSGANILTGETGAGKSILVGALGLLMGRRAASDLVRAGATEAEVSGVFELANPGDFNPLFEALGLATTDEIILRRVITNAGRGRAYVNGAPVPLSQLAIWGEALLSISGQHDQQSLLKSSSQLEYLDRFGGHRDLLAEMKGAWQNLNRASQALEQLESRLKEAEEKRDLYDFQLGEINAVAPRPGEDDELLAEKNQAKSSGKLAEGLAAAATLLGNEPGNVVEKLGKVRRHLELAAGVDGRFESALALAEDCYHQLSDLAVGLEKWEADLDVDPSHLEWVDDRLNILAKLKRKYNKSLADILEHQRQLASVLDELDGAGLDLARLRRDHAQALDQALAVARRLNQARSKAGMGLAVKLAECLKPLGFPRLEMGVEVEAPGDGNESGALGALGFDRVEFLFCPNPGEGMKPLGKIASGGELSRVMLALKIVLDRPGDQLMVFDEIDSGLGGATAEAVSEKMGQLSSGHQVIVITHLPQMAALAGRHFVVAKESNVEESRTVTTITPLTAEQRIGEVARMLGGANPSREAVALAGQLLSGPDRTV